MWHLLIHCARAGMPILVLSCEVDMSSFCTAALAHCGHLCNIGCVRRKREGKPSIDHDTCTAGCAAADVMTRINNLFLTAPDARPLPFFFGSATTTTTATATTTTITTTTRCNLCTSCVWRVEDGLIDGQPDQAHFYVDRKWYACMQLRGRYVWRAVCVCALRIVCCVSRTRT